MPQHVFLIIIFVLSVAMVLQSLFLNQIWKDRERRRREKKILLALLDAKKQDDPGFVSAVRQLLDDARARATAIRNRSKHDN